MLVEIAIGDAYGAGFEYADQNLVKNDLSKFVKHPTHDLQPGQYTDDTQMSIAIAELLIEEKPFDENIIIAKFIEVFKRDPRDGYSRGFQAILERISTVAGFKQEVVPDSDKSGGAMRAGPLGTLPDAFKVIVAARQQAKITHNTIDGIAAAQAVALMTHYFLYDKGPKAGIGQYLTLAGTRNWDESWTGKVKAQGWMDVRAAVTCIKATDNLADCLKMVVDFGGDTDTAAAITMAAASCSKEMKKNLPQHLYDTLEKGKYGLRFLRELDEKLMAKMKQGGNS
jgi:ADP-ribosyl-[dinitrogen reductase] hydrolase